MMMGGGHSLFGRKLAGKKALRKWVWTPVMKLMKGYTLDGCPPEITEAWAQPNIDNPLGQSSSAGKRIFSGPALMAMQAQLPNLAIYSSEEHISKLSLAAFRLRHKAEKPPQNTR